MERLRDIFMDIVQNYDSPEKIQIIIDPTTRNVQITLEDLGDAWFTELQELSLTVMGIPQVVEKGV